MIIQFDNSLTDLANSNPAGLDSLISMLELVAISYREGNHLVYAEPALTLNLLNLVADQSRLARALLLRIKNKHPQTAELANNVKVKLLVGAFDMPHIEKNGDCRIIKYPTSSITSNTIQKTLILVENLTDIDFYKWIAKKTLNDTNYKSTPLSLEGYPGGGNTTAEAYANIKDNTSRLCLCIVDSDIRAPGLSPGETAKKVYKHDSKFPNSRTSHFIIDACSIENLVPFAFYEHVWKEDNILKNRLEIYRDHYRASHWKYIQLKKHITCFEVRDKTAFSTYWSTNLAYNPAGCTTQNRNCSKKSDCNQLKLESLSSAPLAAILAMDEENMSKVPYQLLPDIQQAWENLAHELLGWCCAAPSSSL